MRLEKAKGLWAEELPTLLWAYHITPLASTDETPFSLTFGIDVVVPTEISLTSYRVDNFCAKKYEKVLRQELDLIEKKRE